MPSSICCSQHKRKQQILHPRLGHVGVAHVECILRSRSCFFQQYPLLVPSVHCPQRVWGCVCACACVQHWHSTERTDMWICQHSAYVKFILSTRTHMHARTHTFSYHLRTTNWRGSKWTLPFFFSFSFFYVIHFSQHIFLTWCPFHITCLSVHCLKNMRFTLNRACFVLFDIRVSAVQGDCTVWKCSFQPLVCFEQMKDLKLACGMRLKAPKGMRTLVT